MKEILDSAPNKFCPVLNNVLLGAVGAVITLIINHFKQRHDKKVQLKNDIYSLFCKFFFILHIQYSELINHKKGIEDRLSKRGELNNSSSRDDIVYVFQDFDYDESISINVDDLSKAIYMLRSMKSYQSGDAKMLQPMYLLNKKYHEIIDHFATFNEMKKAMRDQPNAIEYIAKYFDNFMVIVIKKIDTELDQIKLTLKFCDDLFKKLGKHRPAALGDVVPISEIFSTLVQDSKKS